VEINVEGWSLAQISNQKNARSIGMTTIKEMIEYFSLVSVEGAFVIAIVSSRDIFKDEIIILIKFCQFSSIFLLY
jgi:hypothetical protein